MKHDDDDNTAYLYLLILGVVVLVSAFVLAWVLA
jgi:uncharacterized protein (DUF983 family)